MTSHSLTTTNDVQLYSSAIVMTAPEACCLRAVRSYMRDYTPKVFLAQYLIQTAWQKFLQIYNFGAAVWDEA